MAERLFDRAGMRPSDNVEVRDPNDPKEKADVERMNAELRLRRLMTQATLNEPENIWKREEMENWLNDRARNDPDFNEPWDAKGKVQISDPIGQQIVKADADMPGQKVKAMPEITAGTPMNPGGDWRFGGNDRQDVNLPKAGSKGEDKINFKVKPTPPSSQDL
jgi:hypothetical protein